jgi:hypothetical protein
MPQHGRKSCTENFNSKNSVIGRIFFAICIAGDANFHRKADSGPSTPQQNARGTENAGFWRPAPAKLLLAN